MKPKILTAISFTSLLFAAACSGNVEYAYNEFVTDIFSREMSQVDGAQKIFSDSLTIFSPQGASDSRLKAIADNIADNAKNNIKALDSLKNKAPAAAAFHNSVSGYFKSIEKYGKSAGELIQEKDLIKKHMLYANLNAQYQILNKMPDSILTIQKQYLEKAGLKP